MQKHLKNEYVTLLPFGRSAKTHEAAPGFASGGATPE